ncbi:hypothetical protein VP01_9837g2, partial [Puccinia sorghi]
SLLGTPPPLVRPLSFSLSFSFFTKMKKQHLKNRLLPNSTRNLNISLMAASTLSINGAFSCSIQDFTRILLQVKHPKSSLPLSPPQSQFSGFNNHSAEQSPSEFFADDLAVRKIHHISFAWDQYPSYPHNDWLSSLILKHWTFAKNNDLLNRYHFSPTDDTPENVQRVLFVGSMAASANSYCLPMPLTGAGLKPSEN